MTLVGDKPVDAAPDVRYRPIRSWRNQRRPVLRGIWFPIAVFVVWRLVQLWMSVGQGGDAVTTAYGYDGEHYLRIMHLGYWNPRPYMPPHAFFPGISWFATPLYRLTSSDAVTVHVTATVTGAAAFVCVWGASKAWKNEQIARRATILFAVFPSSMFLWTFYSEALFIALGAGAVWADRRDRRWIATACMFAVATTRTVGILIPAVIVVARIIRARRIDRWAVTYSAAGLAGLLAVIGVIWHQVGDPFAWLGVQDDWGRSISPPWVSVQQGFENLHPKPGTVMIPALVARNLDLWAVPIVTAPILYAAFSRRDRYPMETWMLGVAMIILPLCSSALASFNRFVLADWIIYPVWASFLGRLPKWVRWPAMVAIVIGFTVVAASMVERFSAGRFIG